MAKKCRVAPALWLRVPVMWRRQLFLITVHRDLASLRRPVLKSRPWKSHLERDRIGCRYWIHSAERRS